jgi:hypothetical protein
MADETRHARLSFALASGYRAEAVGPGPLSMDGAFAPVSVKTAFATLVREGCIGKTLAAVEATEALSRATDGAARDALREIARDETNHAELSWRAARWVIAGGDADFQAWAEAELALAAAEVEARLASPPPRSAAPRGEAALAEHGVLDDSTRDELAAAALRDVVRACARALFAPSMPSSARAPARRETSGHPC